jgi:transposase
MKMVSMNAYSKDLRLKVLSAIDRGIPRKEVAELFGVSLSTIKRWLKRRRLTGDVETMKIPGRPSVKGEALRQWLPKRIRELIEARGAELVFVPSYSPDLNPIEQAFSKIKNILRKLGARTHEALLEAMEEALSKITPADAAGWFDHCGYQVQVQYL